MIKIKFFFPWDWTYHNMVDKFFNLNVLMPSLRSYMYLSKIRQLSTGKSESGKMSGSVKVVDLLVNSQ